MGWIHRAGVQGEFAQIPNATLRDKRLSYAARGVLAEILSRPDDWRTSAAAMAMQASKVGEGRYGMAAIFRELVAAGYVAYEISRGPGGRFATHVHFYDVPRDVSAAHTGNRSTATRSPGKRPAADPAPGGPSPASPPPGAPAPGGPPPARRRTEQPGGRRSSRTPSTNTEHEDRPDEHRADVAPWDDDDLIKITCLTLTELTNRLIPPEWAKRVLRQIFEGRTVKRRVPYLRRVLREDPARYLPPSPPRRPPAARPGVATEDKPAAAEADLAGIRKRGQR